MVIKGTNVGRSTNLRKMNTIQRTYMVEPEAIKILEDYSADRNVTRSLGLNDLIYEWAELTGFITRERRK